MPRGPLPKLDHGLTLLRLPSARSTGLHRLVINEMHERDGVVFWIDARNEAVPFVLYELAPYRRFLDSVRVARAFTAYQHHTLARQLVQQTTERTAMIVAPNVGSLYEDDDVPEHERWGLFEAALSIFEELGSVYEIPVIVTNEVATAETTQKVITAASQKVDVERTRMGLHYSGDVDETKIYVKDGFWQTTIPYWVDLFGQVQAVDRPTADATVAPETLEAFR